MKAQRLLDERQQVADEAFVEIRVWRVPTPVRGSTHDYKYALVLIVRDQCVLRYDNEAGKGDHRHLGDVENAYTFVTVDRLLADFWRDVDGWEKQ